MRALACIQVIFFGTAYDSTDFCYSMPLIKIFILLWIYASFSIFDSSFPKEALKNVYPKMDEKKFIARASKSAFGIFPISHILFR